MHLSTIDLGHRFYDGPFLFEHLNARLEPGRLYAVTGPSGSGKSTLLGILAGWITPAAGRVERDGVNNLGWIFQNPHGVARRSALDHTALPLIARGATRHDAETRAHQLLATVGLGSHADRPFASLSGGEAQRLMLARGIAAGPDLLLVDEPTAQLDQRTAATVGAALDRIAAEGTIIVVATHDPRIREACTDVIDLGGMP